MSRGAGRIPPGIYARDQGGAVRYYGRIGDRRVPLVALGEKRATTSLEVAIAAYGQLVAAEQKAQLRGLYGLPQPVGLASYAAAHLVKKAQAKRVTDQSLAADQLHLERAVVFFGAARELATIDVPAVTGWIAALRDRGLGNETIRKHVHSLSNTFRRAQAEGRVSLGYNPVSVCEKPSAVRGESAWLDVDEAALLLEAARLYRPSCTWFAVPFAYELVATYLLTGGRPSEVTGLEVADVSLDRETVTFRPHAARRLKTHTSHRTVPLWPQLREILGRYLAERPPHRLLFPSFRTGAETRLRHPHRIVEAVAECIGYTPGEITPKSLRHTYCAARLQTLDAGAPVSPFTVGRELGHGGDALVKAVYGHLGNVRHRSAAVEYRVEQHATSLRDDRLAVLRHVAADTDLSTESDTVSERAR